MARITDLTTYPVKGCAGVPMAEAMLTEAGLSHDRSFMVVDDRGVFRSQRGDPRLATIRPSVEGRQLVLRAPGAQRLALEIDFGLGATADLTAVEMFGEPYLGIDQGERTARWLTSVLGAPSRLVRVPQEHGRVTDGLVAGTSGFADSCAVHILSSASLDELNRRITAAGRRPVPMARFRPNVVVDGWGDDGGAACPDGPYADGSYGPGAHREDLARRVTLGNARLGYAKLAIRCAVTLVNQEDGSKGGPEPLHTLAAYRRAREGGVAFGSKFAVLEGGKVALGDVVTVTEWGASEL